MVKSALERLKVLSAKQAMWIGVGISCIIAGVLGLFLTFHSTQSSRETLYRLERLPVEVIVRQRGILESSDKTPAIVQSHGFIQEIVKSGTVIQEGEVVFVMDGQKTREEREELALGLERDKLNLATHRAEYDFVKKRQAEQLSLLKAELNAAETTEAYELSLPNEEAMRLLEIEKQLAIYELEEAQSNYDRNLRLHERGFVSDNALKPYERSLESARVFLEESELKIILSQKGISGERRVELRRAVERAEANLKRNESKTKRLLGDIESRIESSEKRIAKAEFEIAEKDRMLSMSAVKAERDGVVRVLEYWDWRSGGQRREYSPGIEKYPQDTVAEIINPSVMKIVLAFHESDVAGLREGMKTRVAMPAFPGVIFGGELVTLGSIGRDRNKIDPGSESDGRSGIMTYNAEVEFDGLGYSFKPGMSAMVSVIVEDKKERLVVPRAAVEHEDGNFYVRKNGVLGVARSEMKGRYIDERYFEVEAGLDVGDEIVVRIGEVEADEGV